MANNPALADHRRTTGGPQFDWDASTLEQGRIMRLLDAALPAGYEQLCDDAVELKTAFKESFRASCGLSDKQAEYMISVALRGLEAAVWKTDWRQGYRKTRKDACVPEVAAKLSISAIRLVQEAFSSGGMRAYRNRHREFIEAMAEFAEEANGSHSANRCFYELLGKRVAQVVLDHKLTTSRPMFAPSTTDYEAVEEAALTQLVYFIQVGESGPIKIGIARDPATRLATLQTGHHEELCIRAITVGGAEQEAQYHAQFSACRIRGEWFSPHPDILAEIERLSPAQTAAAA